MDKQAIATPDWLKNSAILQINLRTFSKEGTLKAATDELFELAELGFKTVYLCPIYEEDTDENIEHWSIRQRKYKTNNPKNPYRIKDYFQIDEEYGSLSDLKKFVNTAHKLNMRVILDLVYAHVGPNAKVIKQFPQFALRDENGEIIYNEYCFVTLDFSNIGLREYLYSNMMFYLCEFDVDGFRCDYCDGIPEEFWIEAKNRMNAIKPDAVLIEEGSKKERLTTCFNAIYCFSWHEDLYKLLLGKIDAFKVRNTYESFKKGLPLNSLVLRDLENHDTVTDWPIRCDLVAGYSAMDIMLVLNYVIDGVPLIYCGNEIADTSNVNLFANRFFPGVYEATDRSIKNQPYSLKRQALIKRLNALRYESKALQSGNTEWIDNSKPENTLSFVREYNGEKLLFVGNFSDKNIRVKLELESFVGQIIMENKTFIHNDYTIELNSYGYLILKM